MYIRDNVYLINLEFWLSRVALLQANLSTIVFLGRDYLKAQPALYVCSKYYVPFIAE